jgi:hypothetical protein
MIFSIDEGMPYVLVNSLPVSWHTGQAAMYLATSSLARLNERGLVFKDRGWQFRALGGEWRRMPCRLSPYGLCASGDSVAFPSGQTPVVDELQDYVCASHDTNRAVTNSSRYDASSCDLAVRDFVFAGDSLYVSTALRFPDWVYWTVCVLIVYLVRCLSKYILCALTKKDFPNEFLCVAACVLVTVLIVSQGDAVLVTTEDVLVYYFTLSYIVCYILLFASTRAIKNTTVPFYNLLCGVMQLTAIRIFGNTETAYTPPLDFIIMTRIFVKSRRGNDILRSITTLLDAFMLSLMAEYGFMPDPRYLAAAGAAAWAASDILVAD